MYCVGKLICNIGIYQPETDTLIGIKLEDTIAFHEKKIMCDIYLFINQKLIHLLPNIRRCHCITWEKIICIISIIYLPDQKLIHLFGMRIFPTVPHREFPYVLEGNPHYTLVFFINYCTLINIFSTQLWGFMSHTQRTQYTHTKRNTCRS